MPTDDHYRAFVEESREGIATVNDGLLALESDPEDEAAMGAIFRAAHTIKGNAAAMGFDEASSLAHALEDLLDEVRDGNVAVTSGLVDLLFEGVDELERVLADIAEDGVTDVDAGETRTRLRAVVEDGDPSSSADDGSVDDGSIDDVTVHDPTDRETTVPDDAPDAGALVRAEVTVAGDMAGVDAMFVLQAADDAFASVSPVPDRDAVEDGVFDESVALFVPGDDPDVVAAGLEAVSQVDDVTATLVRDESDERLDVTTTGDAGEGGVDAGDTDGADPAATPPASAAAPADESADTDDGSATGGFEETINSVRIDVEQLDDLYGLVEQLVTSRIKLRSTLQEHDIRETEAIDELDKLSSNLQNTVMDMRLIPLKKVIRTFPRLVRDTARDLDKRVEFETTGADVELDRTILTEIRDPLIHVLRNSVDHGIESPDEREAAGKSPTGLVTLEATRERDHVTITVADDGDGLDRETIGSLAVDRGVVTREELSEMTDGEVYDLVFEPGFSTADEVTDVSGRGVGMDVVRSTVTQLDGTVGVESTPGEGTTVTLRLPVTIAIVKMMFLRVGDAEFGIPVKNVDEVSRATDVERANGDDVVRHDGDLYPVVHLDEELAAGARVGTDGGRVEPTDETGMLLRIRPEERAVALHCDRVVDQEEVVVKPLEGVLSGTPGLGGTAVLGDGDIVPILDVMTL